MALFQVKKKKLLKTFNQEDNNTDLCSRSLLLKLTVHTNSLKGLLK